MRDRQAADRKAPIVAETVDATGPPTANNQSRSKQKTPADLLDGKALAQVGQLDLLSQSVVDGFLSGKHRSTHKGGCCEFADHRPYTPGDELRLIDWRLYGRSDRYFVKQFEDETNLQALMIVDASGSMDFGMSTISKFDYARIASACLSRLLLRQRDSVGLAVIDKQIRQFIPPVPRASHLQKVLEALCRLEATGESQLGGPIVELGSRLRRRGLVCLFSDCFGDIAQLSRALQQLRLRGHDVIVFQVLAPEETSFQFRRRARFYDLEKTSRWLNVNPGAVRRRYLQRLQQFQADLHHAITRIGCDLVSLSTEDDLGDTLSHYLCRRAAQKRLHRTSTRA